MRRLASLLPLLLLLSTVGSPGPASARVSTQSYVGTFDPLTFGRCAGTIPQNIGKVCFKKQSGETKVKITSADVALGEAGLFYVMIDSSGGCVGDPADPTQSCPNDGFICGHSTTLALPSAAVGIDVYPLGSLGVVDCAVLEGSDVIGASTTGTVTATFS